MNINGIDIHEKILTAQQNNELIIFAGAGVSVAPPSNLPDFIKLCRSVEKLTLCRKKKEEPIDTYLGRVYHSGKNIYEIIGEILSDPKSRHNDYHTNLLKLFPQNQIRLVTTNQDEHFSSAAYELFQNDIKKYYAPALPLAKSFAGIVYLHGNLADNLRNMIFTDSDFGEAYLVEGWASRFLKDLFNKYIILFIGYSYTDPVMKYFSRGMEYNENRFIFTSSDDKNTDDHWKRLHITPIYYNDHNQLLDCIAKWAKLYSLKYTDQKERLRVILSNDTTMTSDDKDYIFYMISKDYGVNFFCDLASEYYWFKFLLNEGKLEFIFSDKKLSFNQMCLIQWVIEKFLTDNIEDFLINIVQKGNYINLYFTNQVFYFFYNAKKEEKKKCKKILTEYHYQLFSLMLHQPYKLENNNYLELLLLELEVPKDINIILILFKYMIKPEIKLEKSFRMTDSKGFKDSTDQKFTLFGELHWITKAWEEKLYPNINLIAYDLILTVSDYIKHLYLFSNRNNIKGYDSLSGMRSSIERHVQDQYGEDFLFLVDIARDTIDFLISDNMRMCDSIISMWSNSNTLILERLSIYGVKNAKHINPNEKVNWVIEKHWLHKPGAKKEIFDLIKYTYTDLTIKTKKILLREICNSSNIEDNELRDYQVYTFLIYLDNSFPNDEKIKTELRNVIKRNPSYKPSEHPEFDSFFWSGDYDGIRSPKSKKELLSEDPVSVVRYLIKYRDSKQSEFSWSDLLRELAEAVGDEDHSYIWVEKLVDELEGKKALSSEIFISIIQGLEKEPIPPVLLEKLLKLIKVNYNCNNVDLNKQISWLILGQTGNNKEVVRLIGANAIFDFIKYIYNLHKKNELNIDIEKNVDENTYPNISIASNLMTCIFRMFVIIMEEDKKLVSDTANTLFDFIEEIAFDKCKFSMNAKPIIAIDYSFINYYRPKLADKLVTLFDINNEKECARVMWKGFLYRGKYNDSIVKKLFNNYKKLFTTISEEDNELIKAFCFKTAGIAIYCEIKETRDKEWIMKMINSVSNEVRVMFADALNRELIRLDVNKADDLWENWIGDYWYKRNKNIPVELSKNEISEMMQWVIHFDKYFDVAVEYITQKELTFSTHILIGFEKKDDNLIEKHPNSVGKYFYHMLKNISPGLSPFNSYCILEFSKKVFKYINNDQIKNRIEQELVRLGII